MALLQMRNATAKMWENLLQHPRPPASDEPARSPAYISLPEVRQQRGVNLTEMMRTSNLSRLDAVKGQSVI